MNDGNTGDMEKGESRSGLSFNEWVRRKDAEKRMKQRLVNVAKDEIKQELFEMAQKEQMDQDVK